MKSIEKSLNNDTWRALPDARKQQDALLRLRIYENDVQVKVETNGIFRGAVFPPQQTCLTNNAADAHGIKPFNVLCASFEDVYAGKFCAAVTRQHPRDLFDLKHFFENHDITTNLRQAFIVYLCSDRRPFHEILSPRVKPESTAILGELR